MLIGLGMALARLGRQFRNPLYEMSKQKIEFCAEGRQTRFDRLKKMNEASLVEKWLDVDATSDVPPTTETKTSVDGDLKTFASLGNEFCFDTWRRRFATMGKHSSFCT